MELLCPVQLKDSSTYFTQANKAGSLALAFAQHARVHNGTTQYHGTPVSPDQMGEMIQTRQPRTQIRVAEASINHGAGPAVCTSVSLRFPVLRSLLHDNHPSLTDWNYHLTLHRRINALEQSYIFTAAEVLRRLVEDRAVGYVYAIHNAPASAAPYHERADLDEWRIPEDTRWDLVMRTTVHDLPGSLLVMDTGLDDTRTFFDALAHTTDHPLQLAADKKVPVLPFRQWQTAAQIF